MTYIDSKSITRHKILNFPKINKTISFKNSGLVAMKIFNTLPNELKTLNLNKVGLKRKMY